MAEFKKISLRINGTENMKKRGIIISILILVLLLISPACAAVQRTDDNTGIQIGNTVYTGEKNLNFTSFKKASEYPDYFTTADGLHSFPVEPDGKVLEIPTGTPTATYYAHYSGGVDTAKMCYVKTASLGHVEVKPFTVDTDNTRPAAILWQTGDLIFYLADSTIQFNELTIGPALPCDMKISDLAAITKYSNIQDPTDKTDASHVFSISDISLAVIPSDVESDATVSFSLGALNGLSKMTASYTFKVLPFRKDDISTITVAPSDTADRMLTLTGIPFHNYVVKLVNTPDSDIRFSELVLDHITRVSDTEIYATPSWEGSLKFAVKVFSTTKDGSYDIIMDGTVYPSRIKVIKEKSTLIFSDLPSDADRGLFAEGDYIHLEGTIQGATENLPVYLYLTGPNVASNGANMTTLGSVVDNVTTTFTVVWYSYINQKWEYNWKINVEPGVYTIHANLKPYGYYESTNPDGIARTSHKSHDISVSDQSLILKSDPENSGHFAQGDEIKYNFAARGSPGDDGTGKGMVRWYIIGQNFRYTDYKKFQLVEDINNYRLKAPEGISEFSYDRDFSNNLHFGTYYLLMQHPGPDGKFDVTSDVQRGNFDMINTSSGKQQNIGALQKDNSAYALTEIISRGMSDDLYIISEMVIEEPAIKIDKPENLLIGDRLEISGTTNFAEDDIFRLRIYKADFSTPENNMAMLVETRSTSPKSSLPYEKYGTNTFKFDAIDTATWFDASYVAEVENIDTGYKTTNLFTVSAPGTVISKTTLTQSQDAALSPTPKSTPPIQNTVNSYDNSGVSEKPAAETKALAYSTAPVPIQTNKPAKSPGFVFSLPAVIIAFALFMRRK